MAVPPVAPTPVEKIEAAPIKYRVGDGQAAVVIEQFGTTWSVSAERVSTLGFAVQCDYDFALRIAAEFNELLDADQKAAEVVAHTHDELRIFMEHYKYPVDGGETPAPIEILPGVQIDGNGGLIPESLPQVVPIVQSVEAQ